MTLPSDPSKPADSLPPNPGQVSELLSSPELAKAAENDDFKRFLDHIPIAIVISRGIEDQQHIVYANGAFEALQGQSAAELEGKRWSILDGFVHEDDPALSLSQAIAKGEDFLGTFRAEKSEGKHILVQAYASAIEDENGAESYLIAALVDVTDRQRDQREAFEQQIRN